MYNAPDRVYTANCVRMVSMNHYSQQGIVHMLDGAMKPATKTVAQLLQSEAHFESFRNCEWFLKSTLKVLGNVHYSLPKFSIPDKLIQLALTI